MGVGRDSPRECHYFLGYSIHLVKIRASKDPQGDRKLLVGMLVAFKSFAQQIAPDPVAFNSFATPLS